MAVILPLITKFPIIALACAFLVSAAFGRIVKENLEHGIAFNGLAAILLSINLALLALASTFSCSTSASLCLPGLHPNDAVIKWLAAPGFYAILGGFVIVPVSALVLSAYAFGWVYWIIGGRKRYQPTKI